MTITEPLGILLPLRGLGFRLQFSQDTLLPPFKQIALTGFLRGLLDHPSDYEHYLLLDIPEPSRLDYPSGEAFRFCLLALPGGEALLQQTRQRLENLPFTSPIRDKRAPFRDNLRFDACFDPFTGEPWSVGHDLPTLDWSALQEEAALWRDQTGFTLRLLTPTRLLRHKQEREGLKGERRFCHNNADLDQTLWQMRLHDALANATKGLGGSLPPRETRPQGSLQADVFWIDAEYYSNTGARKPTGGLMGRLDLALPGPISGSDWKRLVLGQYLGIGQRRAFGLGRYRLETPDGRATVSRDRQLWSYLLPATQPQNMLTAWQVINDNQETKPDDEPEAPDPDRLERLARRMRALEYKPSWLLGWLHRDPDGDTRALAVPPFYDRVAQRAVSQVLTPYLDTLMDEGSYGYRRGRSRFQARDRIISLYHQGYRWVFESDIENFFDTVDWPRLETRLKAVLGDDPLVHQLLDWVQVPVEYQGRVITRSRGLPQGAPLSPLLANLVLDDFDSDLRVAGCRLVRFADDFLILAKSEQQARAAGELAHRSLDDLGLGLNGDKTRITDFASGFRFLGFLFVNGMAIEIKPVRKAETHGKEKATGWPALAQRMIETASDEERLEQRLRKHAPVHLQPFSEHKTSLYVCGEPSLLVQRDGRLCVERDDKPIQSAPWSRLQDVLLIGPHHITTPALKQAMLHQVPVHFANAFGRYQGVALGMEHGCRHDLWSRQQAHFAIPQNALAAARELVAARIHNMREVLRRKQHNAEVRTALQELQSRETAQREVRDLLELNGHEGYAGRLYFGALQVFVPEVFGFIGRNRRPPKDPFNALLSLGYTMLAAHLESLLLMDGLDPRCGFYHQPHGAHPVLVSDLMEPFRHEVERVAVKMLTQHRLKPEDFTTDKGGVLLTATARRVYLGALTRSFARPRKALGEADAADLFVQMRKQNHRLIDWMAGRQDEFHAWRVH